MYFLRALSLYFYLGLLRLKSRWAVKKLIDAFLGDNEDISVMAGMMLFKEADWTKRGSVIVYDELLTREIMEMERGEHSEKCKKLQDFIDSVDGDVH